MRRIFHIRMISSIVLILFVLTLHNQAFACTIFCKQQGDTVLVGNNEDWMYSISSSVWFVAPDKGNYGRVCFANASYVQGGMNEKGLFYDGATCPSSKVPHLEGKPELGMDFGEVVLSKCANVQEAVEMIKKYNIPRSFSDHIMFADQSGNSVVVEWVEDKLRILPKEKAYQLVTNFWLTNPNLGGYPCTRFDKAKQMLEDDKAVSVSYFADILKATSQSWGDGGTKYSNVYDLKNKEVYVYPKGNFDKSIKYNLQEELKKLKKGEKRTYKLDELLYKEIKRKRSQHLLSMLKRT